MTTRRNFIRIVPVVGTVLIGTRNVFAQAAPMLDAKDPQAVALGYVADVAKVDKAKFPKFAPGQLCSNCQLYTGQANAATGPCSLFAGKQVAAKGWCSAWVKKA